MGWVRTGMETVEKTEAVRRLKSVRGHVEGLMKMLEDDAYCVDVIKQISAIRGALDKIADIELRQHFKTCTAEAVARGRSDDAVDELMSALRFR
ncbi:MAG: hypothetical protein NVS3B28_20750 [Candidatus Velthaea sp.]